jgi:hypothetical protein
MPQKKHKPEEIVGKLRQVDVFLSQGRSVGEAVRSIGMTQFTYHVLPLWTALPLQVDFELIRLARCKHLSGVTRSIGAPKWGIRSHLPLQLVGL